MFYLHGKATQDYNETTAKNKKVQPKTLRQEFEKLIVAVVDRYCFRPDTKYIYSESLQLSDLIAYKATAYLTDTAIVYWIEDGELMYLILNNYSETQRKNLLFKCIPPYTPCLCLLFYEHEVTTVYFVPAEQLKKFLDQELKPAEPPKPEYNATVLSMLDFLDKNS